MRLTCAVLLAGLCALAVAVPFAEEPRGKIADQVFLQKQKEVLRLFKYINQPSYYKDFVETAKTYSVEKNLEGYTNPKVVKEFLYYYKLGFLPRGEIFSVFNEGQLKQAVALFKIFYYAKDFETFHKTAVWARQYINEGLFLYSVSVALVHRDDTYGIILPPIYEVYPYYFFPSEVIQKAQIYKQKYPGVPTEVTTQKGYAIQSNYTGWYLNVHPEQSISYFTEDIGINAYYYYYNLYYPFWLGGEEFKLNYDRRGEQYYYVHQQLLARYYLERLSNDFGEIPTFSYKRPIETGYYPSLRYPNGLEFTVRPNYAYLLQNYHTTGQSFAFKGKFGQTITYIKDYERRIRDAIDRGYVFDVEGKKWDLFEPKGLEILGNLIESNRDSVNYRYYGSLQTFARHLLGYSLQPLNKNKIAPSALEHFETSLRDPVFWQFYKRVIYFFQRYKSYLPKYTVEELVFPGVKVENVEVDRLVTYFEKYDVDVTQAVYVTPKEFESDSFAVRARVDRLNYKPFTYKIYVNSERPVKSVVRVFIGPKYDEYDRPIDINENRVNFVEFDKFVYEIQTGKNIIERTPLDTDFVPDRTTFKKLYQDVEAAIAGEKQFRLDGIEAYYGFPLRYLLPKGTRGGQTYQFYVIVSPWTTPKEVKYQQNKDIYYPKVGTGYQYIDNYPLGYPFDRVIDKTVFKVPNSYFKDVVIYNREIGEINTSSVNKF